MFASRLRTRFCVGADVFSWQSIDVGVTTATFAGRRTAHRAQSFRRFHNHSIEAGSMTRVGFVFHNRLGPVVIGHTGSPPGHRGIEVLIDPPLDHGFLDGG